MRTTKTLEPGSLGLGELPSVDFDLFDTAVAFLANELLMIEVLGDYDRAKKLEAQYSGIPDFVQSSLESLKDLPIDFVPQYEIRWK